MKISTTIISCLLFFFNFSIAQNSGDINGIANSWRNSTCSWEENNGQLKDMNGNTIPYVFFKTETEGLQIYITQRGLTYFFNRKLSTVDSVDGQNISNHKNEVFRIDAEFQNASIKRENIEYLELNGNQIKNFYTTENKNPVLSIHDFNKIRIKNIYPGINWLIYFNKDGLKYDFELAAGIEPGQIKLLYKGAEMIELDAEGNLNIGCRLGTITEKKPVSFQGKRKIETSFSLSEKSLVGFKIKTYDSSKPIILDPQLIWSTHFGGNSDDIFNSIQTDTQGNLFAVGYSTSLNFPTINAGTYYDNINAATDAVIVKFNSNYQLQWATFYGGSAIDEAHAISIDASGNIFVGGNTASSDFSCLNGGGYFDDVFNGSTDIFLLKFNNAGTRLLATFIGGSSFDQLNDIDIDLSGNVLLIGYTGSTNFPMQASGYSDNSLGGSFDAILMKLDNTGALLWSTYYGGSGDEYGNSIAADNNGNFFITGETESSNFTLLNSGTYFDGTLNGPNDIFLSKFSATNAQLWSTYYGGNQLDYGMAVDIDNAGNAIIAGTSNSSNFPCYSTGGAYSDNLLGNGSGTASDLCILKFSNSGVRLWATYYGGSSAESFSGLNSPTYNDELKADKCGNFYLAFNTFSNDMTTHDGGCASYIDEYLTTGNDCFILKFSKLNQLAWATYFGGESNAENGLTLTLDPKSNLIGAGRRSGGYGFPFIQSGSSYFDNTAGYDPDAFIVKFKNPVMDAGVNYSLCGGGCTGNANIVVNDACSASYSYSWSNGLSSSSASALCAGSYSVTVTDGATCSFDTVNFNLASGINIFPATSLWSCTLGCNGTASVTVPGVSAPTYHWSNGATTSSVSQLCPGTYTVTVTAPGCGSDVASFTIVVPPALQIYINTQDNPTNYCEAPCDGSAEVVVMGGATGATITWSNGTIGAVSDSLCPGTTYTVSVSDSLCYNSSVDVVMPASVQFIASASSTLSCGCNGTATATGGNATPPFTFLWSNGQTTASIDSLCPGTYSVTVTDVPCGSAVTSVIVSSPNPVQITQIDRQTSNCPNNCDASAYAYINGAVIPPINFIWSNGSSTLSTFNLCIDSTYYVTVTDGCGNSDVDSITITATFDTLHCSISPLLYTCPGTCNGVGQAVAGGGEPPYTYLWASGNTTDTEYNLCPGNTYYLTVYDGCGDSAFATFVFPNPNAVAITITSEPSCINSCIGSATANVSNGIPPYLFFWSNGQNGTVCTNLCYDSTYYVTVTDACLSEDSTSVTITLALPGTASFNLSSTACPLTCDGSAEVITTGGTPPFLFYWSNGENTQTVSDLCPDSTYTVIVLDPGCSVDTFTVFIPSDSVTASLTNVNNSNCFSPCDGTATVVATGGSLPYTYQWSSGETTASVSGLCAGTYTITVVANACSFDTVSFTITGPLPFVVTLGSVDTLLCANNCIAQAEVTTTGGSPPFTYSWSSGESTPFANSLCFGNQFVIVSDPGCATDSIPFYVNAVSNTSISTIGIQNTTCNDSCDGAAGIMVSGGINPYTFLWNTNATDSAVQQLCAGVFTVSVTDSIGCVVIDTVFISEPPPIEIISSITESHCENSDGLVSVIAQSGVEPYNYAWSSGSTSQVISELIPGSYYLTVTDANNCQVIDTMVLFGLYPVLETNNDTLIILGNDVNLHVAGALNYVWSPDYNLECDTCATTIASPTITTTYCVTGTDSFGCKSTVCFIIIVSHDCGEINLPSAFTPNNDGHNDIFRVLGNCLLSVHLSVYNRWGELVFESKDKHVGWNGKYRNEDAETGVYSYYVEATNLLGQSFMRKGNVTLLR